MQLGPLDHRCRSRRYRAVGLDPSLPAVQAAYDVANQLGVPADFVVGDARFLPFADDAFDAAFSYSVLGLSDQVPPLRNLADSLYIESRKPSD